MADTGSNNLFVSAPTLHAEGDVARRPQSVTQAIIPAAQHRRHSVEEGGVAVGRKTLVSATMSPVAATRRPMPLYGRFKDKKAEYFEPSPAAEKKQRGNRGGATKRAWADQLPQPLQHQHQHPHPHSDSDGGGEPKKARIGGKRDSLREERMALQTMQHALLVQHQTAARDESRTRQRVIRTANHMVQGLPLPYLYSKPELRHYALEQVFVRLLLLARLREQDMLGRAFAVWRVPPEIHCDDRQIGFIVISQAFQQLLDKMIKRAFRHWAIFYATRYNKMRLAVMHEAAWDIQQWYRHMKRQRSESFKRLLHAVKICIQRRKAIKAMLRYEIWTRKALIKITRGIVHRRRRHLAARSIQRVYRWTMLYRRVMWKMTRLNAVRLLQRFWRMEMARPDHDHVVIKAILRAGGYSKVVRKVPPKLMGKGDKPGPKPKRLTRRMRNEPPPGLLAAVDNCVRIIQRAWMRYKGRSALLDALADKHAEEEREAERQECASIIQNSYRAHLWDKLMLAAVQHNRARRIQRQFRARQYRVWNRLHLDYKRRVRRTRRLVVRERFLRRALLWAKFELQRQKLAAMAEARDEAARVIRRAWFAAKERYRRRLIAEAKRRAALRNASGAALEIVSKMQRNWRQTRATCLSHFDKRFTENRYARHVYLVMHKLEGKRRQRLHHAAVKIQRLARFYLDDLYVRQVAARVKALRVIRKVFKVGLLRFALYRLVVAKRALKVVKANIMKYWWRRVLFRHWMKIRFYHHHLRVENEKWVYGVATRLQRYLHQKWREYYSPGRVVARYEIKKRLEREEAERVWALRDGAARKVQKALRGNRVWNRNLRRIDVERVYYRRHNAAVCIQKFFKMVIAWERFWVAADERQARKEAEEQRRRYHAAANVVGFYWRRWREKRVLATLFRLRRKMLDEYYRVTDERLKAEADRQDALDEVQRSEETMMATVAAAWRQGSDTLGRNYFYNYITGESSWQPPESWKIRPSEMWVRNKDDRDNIYYYNMQTGESRWLAPCCVCGENAERFCIDCGASYCLDHYEREHNNDKMRDHEWSNLETEKEPLRPGEVHCCECKRRVAKVMCTTCWDPYCAECFRYVHHIGALRDHLPVNYKKAKQGWLCIKAKIEGERDYYVNGTTGETSYEKPVELMTPQEKVFYDNFKTHQGAAEEHVKTIEKLQYDLEAASYERDTILFDAINGTGKIGQLLKNRQKALNKQLTKNGVVASAAGVKHKKTTFLQRLMGNTRDDDEYRMMLMSANPRQREKARDAYIQGVIDQATGGLGAESKES